MSVWPEPRWRPSGWLRVVLLAVVCIWIFLAIILFIGSGLTGLHELANFWLSAR